MRATPSSLKVCIAIELKADTGNVLPARTGTSVHARAAVSRAPVTTAPA